MPVAQRTAPRHPTVAGPTEADGGAVQVHLAEKDVMAGFKTGQIVNPLVRGHIAYRTDDLDAFRAHLEAQGVPYSDWGHAAVKGWRQIFFYDPDGNIIEVHEVSATPDGAAGDP